MSSHGHDLTGVIAAVEGRQVPSAVKTASIAAMALGAVAFLAGYAAGDRVWALGAFLVGWVFFLTVAQGGFAFSVLMAGTEGRWGRPLKRLAESFFFFIPVLWVLLAVFFLMGGLTIYTWNPDTIVSSGPVALAPHNPGAWKAKEIWLQPGFFAARALGGLALIGFLDYQFLKASLRPDLVKATKQLGAKAPAWWSRFTAGAKDVDAEIEAGQAKQSTMVPVIAFGYALIMSMFAFDLVMSLAPWWFSNMFGGWFFMGALWVGFATLAAFAMAGRDWLGLGKFVTPAVTHDLGKLMLAGCMFWAYTAFAQLLPIYYADMPEETDFLLVRMFLPQWQWLTKVVGVLCFITPFTILTSRGIKKMRWPFFAISILIMIGMFFENTMLVMPSIYMGDTFPWSDFLMVSIPTFLGFGGAFVYVVTHRIAQLPAVVVADPYLNDHPWDLHVHSLDHADAH